MKNKKCTRCKNILDLNKFPIINKSKNKISSLCVECKRSYDREYWDKVKLIKRDQKNANQKIIRQRNRNYIISFLKKSVCADCSNTNWIVLEFDHKNRNLKSFNLADASSESIDKIQKEIDKCEVVCANCHRIRTATQREYNKHIVE